MTHDHLIPDTDGDLLHTSGVIEELLIALDQADDGPVDPERWITPLAIARGRDAIGNINVAIGRAERAGAPRLLAPDGHFELVPLHRVPLEEDDLAAYALAVTMLGQSLLPGGDEVTADTLRHSDDLWAPRRLPPGVDPAHEIVARATSLQAVLDAPRDADAALLAARLPAAGELVLSVDEHAAYQRYVARFLAIWAVDSWGRQDPLERFVFDGGGGASRREPPPR